MNTSSPCERKTFFFSPGWFANPKNFKLIGGGGTGTPGQPTCGAILHSSSGVSFFTVTGFGGGASISALKMLRPLPSYLMSSTARSRSKRIVGSRDCACCVGPARFTCVAERTGWVGEAGVVEGAAVTLSDSVKARTSRKAPMAARSSMMMTFVRFSVPICISRLAPRLRVRLHHEIYLHPAALLLVQFDAVEHHKHL